MGKRGPEKGNGGRPKKALQDKILEGKARPWQTKVIHFENAGELEGCEMPPPAQYLSDPQKAVQLWWRKIFMKRPGIGYTSENART
jgi:hypothetical protein